MRTLSLLRLKLQQLLLLPPAALIIATDRTYTRTLAHAHAQRVGRHARTHQSHGPTHKQHYAMLLWALRLRAWDNGATIRYTTTAAVLTADGSSSFRNGTGGAVSEIPSRWRHRRRTADFARWSARAPRAVRPPTLRRPELTTRSTYICGRASTRCTRTCTHAHAGTQTLSLGFWPQYIQWRRELILLLLIFIIHCIHHNAICIILYRQT